MREFCLSESIHIPVRIGVAFPFLTTRCFGICLIVPEYGLNFVNLVDRPTADVTMLKKGEEEAGIRRASKIIRSCKPRVVCFIGKIAFNTFYRTRKCDWGWQTEINGVPVYLMHFPIRGPASVRVEELKELKRASRIK